MSLHNFRSELLSEEYIDILANFNCGEDDMNEYLLDYALTYDKIGDAKTTILIDEDTNCVAGYYTLRCSCMRTDFNNSDSVIPTIEIARFATDLKYQGEKYEENEKETISDYLMALAIDDIKEIKSNLAGVRAIMLFALDIPRTIAFYKKNKFLFISSEKCFLNDCSGLQPMFAYLT